MLSSLIITMWIGFGQTVAKNYGTYDVDKAVRSVEGCKKDWNATAPEVVISVSKE